MSKIGTGSIIGLIMATTVLLPSDIANNALAQTSSNQGASAPQVYVHDLSGNSVYEKLSVGQQVTISASFSNDLTYPQQSIALFEVLDSDSVVVFLGWQNSTIPRKSSIDVGVSWIPEKAQDYRIISFSISSFTNPDILTTKGFIRLSAVDIEK